MWALGTRLVMMMMTLVIRIFVSNFCIYSWQGCIVAEELVETHFVLSFLNKKNPVLKVSFTPPPLTRTLHLGVPATALFGMDNFLCLTDVVTLILCYRPLKMFWTTCCGLMLNHTCQQMRFRFQQVKQSFTNSKQYILLDFTAIILVELNKSPVVNLFCYLFPWKP